MQKFLTYSIAAIAVGALVYYTWPWLLGLLIMCAGVNGHIDAGNHAAADHRMKYEQSRGITFVNVNDGYSMVD